MSSAVTKRRWFAVGTAIVVLFVLSAGWYAYRQTSRPLRTHQRFMEHLIAKRLEAAQAMLDPADLEKVPAVFWERCRKQTPFSLIAPNGALLEGRMAMMVVVETSTDRSQLSCVIEGDKIRVNLAP